MIRRQQRYREKGDQTEWRQKTTGPRWGKPESLLWLKNETKKKKHKKKRNKKNNIHSLRSISQVFVLISYGSFIDSVWFLLSLIYPIVKNSLTSWRSTAASRPWGWRSPRTRTRWARRSARRWRSGPPPCPSPWRTSPPATPPPGDAAWTRRRGSVVRTAPGTCPGNGGRRPHGNDSLCCPGDQRFGTRPPLP